MSKIMLNNIHFNLFFAYICHMVKKVLKISVIALIFWLAFWLVYVGVAFAIGSALSYKKQKEFSQPIDTFSVY